MIRVILCDDHALIRRGIRDTLSDAPDIQVVGGAQKNEILSVRDRETKGIGDAVVLGFRGQIVF